MRTCYSWFSGTKTHPVVNMGWARLKPPLVGVLCFENWLVKKKLAHSPCDLSWLPQDWQADLPPLANTDGGLLRLDGNRIACRYRLIAAVSLRRYHLAMLSRLGRLARVKGWPRFGWPSASFVSHHCHKFAVAVGACWAGLNSRVKNFSQRLTRLFGW